MGFTRKNYPFFFGINERLKLVNENQEEAKNELIARNPVFFNKTLFRAFLNYSKKEIDEMSIDEYIDAQVMLKEYLKILHAPYIDNK